MTRRLLGPIRGPIAFFLVAALVFAGLGWVTVASLRVEVAQRESAARAEREANLRVALWRLDGRMLPVLGVEDSRPFHHYAGGDIQTLYGPGTAPLLEPDLPSWMRLHFQIDPHEGWSSPQVMPLVEMERLKGSWPGLSLRNVTPERAALLAELSSRLPPLQVTATIAARERAIPSGSGPLVNWQYATPVGQPLEQLQPLQPSSQPRPVLAPAPSATAVSAEVTPEYKAPLARFERGAQQAGPPKDLSAQVPQSVPGLGLISVNPGVRGPESNTVSESQSRAVILQKGFSDARSASNYQYSQNPQLNVVGSGPPVQFTQGGLGGGGGYATNSGMRKSPAGSGPIAQANPMLAPAVPAPAVTGAAPAGPGAALGADKSGYGMGERPASPYGAAKSGPSTLGRGARKFEDESFFFSNRYSMSEAEKAKALPSGKLAVPGVAAVPMGPPAPQGIAENVRRFDRTDGKQLGVRPATNGLFRDFGIALRYRMQDPQEKGDDRFAGGFTPPVPAQTVPVPAPFAVPEGLAVTVQPVVHLGSIHPQWLTASDGSDVLVLVRTAHIDNRVVYQGVALDWPLLEGVLRESVNDLFPDARLVPVKDPAAVSPERAMTALPVQLEPGAIPAPPPAGWSPLRFGLLLAWVATIIAVVAVGLTGRSLIDLAERRIRFVSAVTHELRTPLTSLRLYLDLLLSGMVQEEAKRREYLATLNVESDRLHRLIDNVLDFARLEGRRSASNSHPVQVAALLDQLCETWTDRCTADEKRLVVVNTLPTDEKLNTDPHLVQQIVGNLIDNARKYTRDAADPRIWVSAKPSKGKRNIVIEVEDRGAGVPSRERASIFRPFRRGDTADARAGGAGLGLALAKQWAEMLGGRLSYRPADGGVGACFRLELRGN